MLVKVHLMIQQLIEPFADIHHVIIFISLSYHCGGILSIHL